jgi:hypothetical protein
LVLSDDIPNLTSASVAESTMQATNQSTELKQQRGKGKANRKVSVLWFCNNVGLRFICINKSWGCIYFGLNGIAD